MKTLNLLLLSTVLALTGCTGLHSGVRSANDPYLDSRSKNMAIMVAKDLYATLIWAEKSGKTGYSIGLTFTGTDWMFIESGESCVVLADGERLPLTGDGSGQFREVLSGGLIRETAWYILIPKEYLVKIANANQASLKVYGTKQTREGRFTDGARKAVSKFLAETEGK